MHVWPRQIVLVYDSWSCGQWIKFLLWDGGYFFKNTRTQKTDQKHITGPFLFWKEKIIVLGFWMHFIEHARKRGWFCISNLWAEMIIAVAGGNFAPQSRWMTASCFLSRLILDSSVQKYAKTSHNSFYLKVLLSLLKTQFKSHKLIVPGGISVWVVEGTPSEKASISRF